MSYNLYKIQRQAEALVASLEHAIKVEEETIARSMLTEALKNSKTVAQLLRLPE